MPQAAIRMRSIFRTARVRAELLLNWYSSHAQRRPVLVGSMTLGTLAACGDLTAQTLEQRNKQVFSFDTTRFYSLVAYAAIYNGPVNTRLYAGYVKLFGDGTLRAAIKGTALDQLVYMPFMAIPVSFRAHTPSRRPRHARARSTTPPFHSPPAAAQSSRTPSRTRGWT